MMITLQWLSNGYDNGYVIMVIEGSLEVKLPTVWTDEK